MSLWSRVHDSLKSANDTSSHSIETQKPTKHIVVLQSVDDKH